MRSTLYVVPGEGKSYSEDLYITAEDTRDTGWKKAVDIDVMPGGRQLVRVRVHPRFTPAGTTTTAGLRFGQKTWIPVAATNAT